MASWCVLLSSALRSVCNDMCPFPHEGETTFLWRSYVLSSLHTVRMSGRSYCTPYQTAAMIVAVIYGVIYMNEGIRSVVRSYREQYVRSLVFEHRAALTFLSLSLA